MDVSLVQARVGPAGRQLVAQFELFRERNHAPDDDALLDELESYSVQSPTKASFFAVSASLQSPHLIRRGEWNR